MTIMLVSTQWLDNLTNKQTLDCLCKFLSQYWRDWVPEWSDTNISILKTTNDSSYLRRGACFSKVPKLFGSISGNIILFVSSERRRLEARNFAAIFIFILFTTYEKKNTALQNREVGVLGMAFRARKVLGTFEIRAPDTVLSSDIPVKLLNQPFSMDTPNHIKDVISIRELAHPRVDLFMKLTHQPTNVV